jgi:hypothetical protein
MFANEMLVHKSAALSTTFVISAHAGFLPGNPRLAQSLPSALRILHGRVSSTLRRVKTHMILAQNHVRLGNNVYVVATL